jgi:RNA polymerase sigma factor (sigma-70 family)
VTASTGALSAPPAPMSKSLDKAPEAGDPDADVARLVTAGDLAAAIRLLMQRHGDAVYRFVRNALRDDARADDVHQRIFIEAYRDLPRFAGRSTLRTWLFAIARYRVIDAAKVRVREEGRLGEGDGADKPDPRPSPGEQIDDVRLREALARCLERLGEHIRSAILLRYQQGFSFEEMAEILREKSGTLQARVSRALPLLRECIEATTGGAV